MNGQVGYRPRPVATRVGGAMTMLVRAFDGIASRPRVAGGLVTAVALVLAIAASAARGFPLPREHDEYSYLLGAETLASGRLTNPTHPMWRYFETFHVLQQPTYASKYPPANALFIAAGWALTGHPIAGVWLSFAGMCLAVYWMLRAWIGARLGLGLSLAFASSAALSYWSYSFWGGAVAATGGALLLGALHRIISRRGGTGAAVALGLGLLILANSRPYEGLLIALPAMGALVWWIWCDRSVAWQGKARRVVLPLALIGGAGAIGMARYNAAVTGSWHKLPYTLYQDSRAGAPLFIWQTPRRIAPETDPTMRAFHAWEDSTYRSARSPESRVAYLGTFMSDFVGLIIPSTLLLPLLLMPVAANSRWNRFAVVMLAWTVAGMGLTSYFNPHYAAPLVGLVLVLYGACLRWLSRLRAGHRPSGSAVAAGIVAWWFVTSAGSTALDLVTPSAANARAALANRWPEQRRLIADTLSRGGRRNLVIVRYGSEHGSGDEWVYNAANIDAAPVIWAHDLGDPGNQPLLDYFRDRAVWVIDVNSDSGPYQVAPYGSRTR